MVFSEEKQEKRNMRAEKPVVITTALWRGLDVSVLNKNKSGPDLSQCRFRFFIKMGEHRGTRPNIVEILVIYEDILGFQSVTHRDDVESLKQSKLRAARILHSRSIPDPLMVKSASSSPASFLRNQRSWVSRGEQFRTETQQSNKNILSPPLPNHVVSKNTNKKEPSSSSVSAGTSVPPEPHWSLVRLSAPFDGFCWSPSPSPLQYFEMDAEWRCWAV